MTCGNYPHTAADPLRLAPVEYPDETVTVYRKQTVAEIALRQPKPVTLLTSDSDGMAKLRGNRVRIISL